MSSEYLLPSVYCPRCVKAGHPKNFGSPRKCGFTPDGKFKPDNWNCATLNELRGLAFINSKATRWNDVSICYIPLANGAGFVVLSWYKDRGRVDNGLIMRDEPTTLPLTLELAENALVEGMNGYGDE